MSQMRKKTVVGKYKKRVKMLQFVDFSIRHIFIDQSAGSTEDSSTSFWSTEKLFTGILTSMERVSEVLSAAFSSSSNALPPTPVRKQIAIKNAMRLERTWLTGRQLVFFINVLEKKTFAAEGYEVIMEDEDLRKEWVKMKLNIQDDE
jgi:hypothetical protein